MEIEGQIKQFIQWEKATRDTIDVKKIYIDIVEDLVAGVLLSQIVYWHLPSNNKSEDTEKSKLRIKKEDSLWLAKGREDWWSECRIKPRQYDTAIEKMVKLGIIEKKRFKFNGSPTTHIRIIWDKFLKVFVEKLQDFDENEEQNGLIYEIVSSISHNGENVDTTGFNKSVNSNSQDSENNDNNGFHEIVNSNLQPESLDNTGFHESVNSNSHNREMNLSKSVKSLTKNTTKTTSENTNHLIELNDMNELIDKEHDKFKFFKTGKDEKQIVKALYQYTKKIQIGENEYLGKSYLGELYNLLIQYFPEQISENIIDIACREFSEDVLKINFNSEQVVSFEEIKNVVGKFRRCYEKAINLSRAEQELWDLE
ncbi:hypothetical protein [Chengkuizengella marina]|uniref:DnaA N-terminal domain-containing protein n=1 Tax=Chengkuizengella marina TaxID=2507566 RepID=A0A6N9Q045_9BACL|nr:hypothetical protein [Chengkuizengella marina]NBI28627.1 hypothetical protein [Chengkuizengella marina]